MGLRIQALFIGALLALIHSHVFALGLGEIRINSALNQPLDAEIELLQVRELSNREILVAIASSEDFKRLGVERPFFLLDLKFEVDVSNANGPIARITSTKSVKEPFLNFVVEAQWPSGKLLREYTVLVDLPVFSSVQQAPVSRAATPSPAENEVAARPSVSSPSQSRSSNFQTVPERNERAVTPVRTSRFDGEEYGPVQARDNLWDIAQKVKPDSSVSVQQTMLAIQRLNPEAFINNNINLIRRGQVLRVPTKEDITSLTQRQAVSQVAQQNRDFSNKTFDSAPRAQLEGSRNISSNTASNSEVEGRVKLSTEDSSPEGSGAGGVSNSEEVRNLKSQLTRSQEQLDATNRENDDLRSRIQAMEEQIKTMEKLMEVSNAEMAALELASKELNQREETEQTETEEPVVVETGEGEQPEGVTESNLENQPDEQAAQVEEPAAQAKEETKPEPVKAVPTPQPKQKSIMDILMENILYVAIGAGALLLAIIAFIFMRGRNDGFNDDEFEELAGDYSFDQPEVADATEDTSSEDVDLDTIPQNFDDALEPEVADEPEEQAVEAETEDVVAECDIHIAYGQYDQAEEKLIRALDREPANGSMRVKLLEVYSAQNDLEAFDAQYAKLRVLGEAELMDRANSLRQNFDGAEPFDTSAFDVSEFKDLVGRGSDSDYDSTDTQIAYPDEEAIPEDLSLDDDKLDFDFDSVDNLVESGSDSADEALNTLEEPQLDLDDDLNFDLDSESDSNDDITQISGLDDVSDEKEESIDLLNESFETDSDLSLDLDSGADTVANIDSEDFSGDDIGELELDLDDGDLDLDLDDVDLDLDLDESLLELDEPSSADSGVDQADDGLDFSLEDGEDALIDSAAESAFDAQIDQEIESIVSSGDAFETESSETLASEPELDLDGDFNLDAGDDELSLQAEDLALDDDGLDLSAEDASAPLLESAGDFELPEGDDAIDLSAETLEGDDLDKIGDFDPGADLDADVNLDALDQELDALAGDLQGELTEQSAGAEMDEPVLDFDEEVAPIVPEGEEQDFDLNKEVDLDLGDDSAFDNVAELDIEEPVVDFDLESDDDTVDLSEDFGDLSEDSLDLEDQPTAEESINEAANATITQEFEIPEFDPEEDDDSNLGFLSDSDETATKLDLARAYIDMGDADGAKDILDEIMDEGNDDQKKEAENLLAKLA